MFRYSNILITFFVLVAHCNFALAKEFPVQARFFTGLTSADPKDVNEVTEAQGLQKIESVGQLGFEATYPVLQYLDAGIRYSKRLADKDEQPSNSATEYNAKVDQDVVVLVARVPLMKSDIVRLDCFAGVGGSNTTLKLKTATLDGEFTRRASGDWFASPYAAAGASVAVGYKRFFLVVEAGYESNKVDSFKTSGTVGGDIETLDLSGSYITVGLLIDGLTGTSK